MIQSTKPFRRAGALLLANLYLFGMGIYFNICEFVARKAHSQFTIDPLENPITFRARRVIRNRNVHIRKLEFQLENDRLLTEISNQKNQIELKIKNRISDKSTKHSQAIDNWTWEFEEDVRAQQAEQRRIESQEYEQRVLEAAAAEKARQEAYKAQRAAEIAAERGSDNESQFYAELRSREEEYYRLNPNGSYGDRVVVGGQASIKCLPAFDMRSVAIMQPYALLSVDGWMNSESANGNGIWFHIKRSNDFPQGGWIHSGSTNNLSTSGLADMNEEPEDTFVVKDVAGTIVQEFSTPTLTQQRIERMRQQTNRDNYTHVQPAAEDSVEGDRWFHTGLNNKLFTFNGAEWVEHATTKAITGSTFSSGGGWMISGETLTTDHIYF